MQSNNKLFDDLARLATGAAGAAASLRGEAEASMRAWLERQLASFDLVTREEFEVVEAMASKAREENEILTSRLDALEKELAASKTGTKTPARKASGAPAKKPASRTKSTTPAKKPAAKTPKAGS